MMTITILLSIIVGYFLISSLYLMGMVLASHYYKPSIVNQKQSLLGKFLIIIPAYKEDSVILLSAICAQIQHYPKGSFDVVVIADSLSDKTLQMLCKLDIRVIEVSFEKSTKVKSIQAALKQIENKYDYAILLDADNIIESDFLNTLNKSIDREQHFTIQLNRVASGKATNGISFWDAFSEYCNNKIACEGPNALGLSSRFTGSGMVIYYPYFVHFINQLQSVGGFDKDMEIRFTEKKISIHYFSHIKVYDEKVSNAQNMGKQRGRWIFAQYEYLFKNVVNAFRSLSHKNYDHFHRVAQLALPPRFLGIVGLNLITALCFFINTPLFITSAAAFVIYLTAYLLLLSAYTQNIKVMLSRLLDLPKLLWAYLIALYYMPKARKTFIHTEHGNNTSKH